MRLLNWQKSALPYAQDDPKRMQSIVLLPAPPNAPQDTDDLVRTKLKGLLTLHLKAFVILVDGHPSVALPTPDAAMETIKLVKDHWAGMPPAFDLDGEPEIVEPVNIESRMVDTRPDPA